MSRTYTELRPSPICWATRTSQNPFTFSSVMYLRNVDLASTALLAIFVWSPFITDTQIVSPLPAFSWVAKENIFLYFGKRLSLSFESTKIWGRQFFVCGGPSSRRRSEYLAAVRAIPRMPSPHSFSALKFQSIKIVLLHIHTYVFNNYFSYLPSVLNVFVNNNGHSHSNQCEIPGSHDHD